MAILRSRTTTANKALTQYKDDLDAGSGPGGTVFVSRMTVWREVEQTTLVTRPARGLDITAAVRDSVVAGEKKRCIQREDCTRSRPHTCSRPPARRCHRACRTVGRLVPRGQVVGRTGEGQGCLHPPREVGFDPDMTPLVLASIPLVARVKKAVTRRILFARVA